MQPLEQSYRLIFLTQGQTTIVDADNFEWLSQWRWRARWNVRNKSFYAVRTEHHQTIAMHRVILGCIKGEQGDHVYGNTLDNRRYNLRKCTNQQNSCNRRMHENNSSGFKGVSWVEVRRKWRGSIGVDDKKIHLGYFLSKKEAAHAYDEAAKKYHGEFARLNFPEVSAMP